MASYKNGRGRKTGGAEPGTGVGMDFGLGGRSREAGYVGDIFDNRDTC